MRRLLIPLVALLLMLLMVLLVRTPAAAVIMGAFGIWAGWQARGRAA